MENEEFEEDYIETDPEMIEINRVNEKYNIPRDKYVRLDECIGKTVKYCNSTKNRKNNTILFIFTDDTFVQIRNDWDTMSDNLQFKFEEDIDYQNLMVDGGLISRELVDEYNKYLADKKTEREKKYEIEQLNKLLLKYPEYR